MTSQATPSISVSVIILTWNSAAHLPRCLACLAQQTCQDFEVLIIDNHSTDDTTLGLEKNYPQLNLRVERLESNLGFAAGNNLGARLARGQRLTLLNADAFLEPDWLAQMLTAAQRHPNAFFSARLVQANAPELLDGQGDVYHISGLAWRRNYCMPSSINLPEGQVFSACAAAAFYPKQAFLAIGGFDEDYFAYHEDDDLGFRLRHAGLQCIYIPGATAHHVGSTSFGKRGERATYLGHRNLVWTYVKNMPTLLFWFFLPLHLAYTLMHLVYFAKIGQGRVFWQARLDAWKSLGAVLKKRKTIQQGKIARTGDILRVMERAPFAPVENIRKRNQAA
jgi:GT2 family glycosyltransferase